MPKTAEVGGPNLTEIASFARLTIKYGTFLIIFLIVGRVLLNVSATLYKIINPPKPPGPTNGFGTLPDLMFPNTTSTVTSYRLETKNGAFPALENQMRVYFMPLNKATLFSLDKSKKVAASLGYVFAPEQFSDVVYRWKKTAPLPSTLEAEIVNQSVTLKTDWASDPNFLTRKTLPQQNAAALEARNLLKSANLFDPDIATGEARVTFLKAEGIDYAPAVSLSEADFVRVDVFRSLAQQRYPILRSDPTMGTARIVFSGNPARDLRVVELQYLHYPIEYERYETYQLLTPAQAWATLQAGNGYVAMIDKDVTTAVVRGVSLAYYDSDIPQNYLQPIYVFSGDNNFFAYVPAVAPLGQSQTTKGK